MPDLSIAHTREIGRKWAAAFSHEDVSAWTSLYANDATYTDYAFGFIRRGKKGLEDHFKIWRSSIPDFRMEVVEAFPGLELNESTLSEHLLSEDPTMVKCTIRTRNIGTFTNDLPSLKASGKRFNFYAVVDLVVRMDDGLIVRVDEWYHQQFDADAIVERDAK